MEGREAQVGLVDAVGAHRLRVTQAREPSRDVVAGFLPYRDDKRLDYAVDGFLLGEGHLQVDLREFRLAVGAKVFVAKTPNDLEVFLESRNHEELLEDLRRLRQSIEGAGIHAAGNQIIA